MTKTEFLQELYNHLSSLSPAERDDILADFEEHFQAGAERGKSEEQICAELGNPYTCALQYLRTAQGAQPQPTAQTNGQTPPQYGTQPPYRAAPQPVRRVNLLWAIAFFIAVFLAIGIYPASALLVLSPIFIVIATVFLAAVVPSATPKQTVLTKERTSTTAVAIIAFFMVSPPLKIRTAVTEF